MKILVKIGHVPGDDRSITVITAEPILDDDLRQFMFSKTFEHKYRVTDVVIIKTEMLIEDYKKVKTEIPKSYYD
jgi:hypothetical protein